MTQFILWTGIAFLSAIGVYLLVEDFRFFKGHRLRAMGMVESHSARTDPDGTFYTAQIRFTDAQGQSYLVDDSFGATKPKLHVGMPVNIVYPADNPKLARVPRYWVRPIVYAFVFGCLILMVALLCGWQSPWAGNGDVAGL